MRFPLIWRVLLCGGSILSSMAAATLDQPLEARDANSSASATGTSAEVSFLQTLQAAQISSMSCLITLVNMTANPIGTCLGLTTLSQLVVAPSTNTSFSNQISAYLGTVCGAGECAAGDISDAQGQLSQNCQLGGTDNTLISVLNAILTNYQNSYHTLACSVHFNGTTDLCLPASLNSSTTGNSNDFFNALVTGNNLDNYTQSVFTSSQCTGCIYEMYKAAVYTLAAIRGQSITSAFGNHLQNDCQGQGGNIDWTNVQDQQIPDALQVQQATPGANGAGRAISWAAWRRYPTGLGVVISLRYLGM